MRRRHWLAWAATAPAAWAQPPATALRPLAHRAGSGTVLLQSGAAERSARVLAGQALQALAAGLDRPPRLLGGMASRDDDAVVLSFAGHQRGALVQGYLFAQRLGATSRVVVVMDDPPRLAASAPQLLAAADAASPPPAAVPDPYANLRWGPVPFGTGQVQLPEGFRIVGQYQGAVDIVGPQGEVASLGAALQVTTPESARYWSARGLPPQIHVAAATQDPVAGARANREASQDRLSAAWGRHLRGTVVVNDSDSGRRSTEWLYQPGPAANGVGLEHNRHMSTVVRDANQAAGYERWQIVNP